MKKRDAGALWQRLVTFVLESHEETRQRLRREIGLPAGRVRVMRWLEPGARTLRELAELTGMDAPATTVVVNDLEERGLVLRAIDPGNRRTKRVSLTPDGRALLERVMKLLYAPPAAFARSAPGDLAALGRILDALAAEHPADS